MAVVVVTAQNTRLDDAEAVGTVWGSDGGGPGGALETDFLYQNSNCFARKGAAAVRGIYLSDNVNTDISGTGTYQTVMFKYICTTPGLLDLVSVPGMRLEIGSGSTQATKSADRHEYDVQGSDTYPLDKSWLVEAIDPNIASHRTSTTGTPDLTNADYYGLQYDQTAVSKSPNQALDAVDVGAGLTLVGGDGADTDGVWQDFSDHDFGTVNNRFGYIRENEGTFIILGKMIIGTATATVFNDTNQVIIFTDGLFAAGFSGITVDLTSATTDVDFTSVQHFSNGTSAGEDTRATFTVTGTSGTFDAVTSSWDNHTSLTLTSAATLTGCIVSNSGLVDSGSGADLAGTSILTSTVAVDASALEWDVNLDPNGELDNMTFTKGTNAHHAIEFGLTSPLTMTMTGMTSTGFNASNAQNDSTFHVKRTSGTVTINIIGGTGNFSYKTDGATVNIVISPVTTLVHADDDTGSDLQNARVILEAADGAGDFPFEESVTITRSGGTATVTHTTHGLETGDIVVIRGADQPEYNGPFTITVTTVSEYTYTVSGSPDTPATGTIISSGAILSGLTDVNGAILGAAALVWKELE